MTTENQVSIRLASPSDASALIELLTVLKTESSTFEIMTDLNVVDVNLISDQIELIQNTTSNLILLATLGEKLIGIATASQVNHNTTVSEIGVAVLAAFQHNGIGTALVDELIYWAESFSTVDELTLTVFADNLSATKIYENLGFKDSKPIKTNIRTMSYNLAPLIG